MRIEQYFLMTDYSLWEVILNGDSPTPTRVVDGVVQPITPTTPEQRLAKKNELKARGTLLIALPDKHQLKFNIHKDAKSLMEAIEKKFSGNKETKKVQLEILSESLSQEDINLKFLRSLPSEWRTHTLIWRNKADLEDQSLDDLFNNLKIYKAEVKSSSSTSHNTQNIAFVSFQTTDITNESVSIVPSVFAASTKVPVSDLPNVDNLSDAEIDLKWQMAMLTMRARRFLQRTKRNLGADGTTSIGSPRDARNKDTQRRNVLVENSTSNALVSQCDGVDSYDWSFQADEEPTNYALMAFTSSSSSSSDNKLNSYESDDSMPTSLVHDRYKSCEGYHVIPPPYTGTFIPLKPDLVFHDASTVSETVPTVFNVEPSTTKPIKEMSQSTRPTAFIIEDWVFDSKDKSEGEPIPTQKEPSFVQTSKHVKTPRTSVKPVEHPKQTDKLRKDIPKSRGHKHRWNRKACFVCKSVNHLIKDCNYYKKKIVQKPVWNHAMRVSHQNSIRMTHPHSKNHGVPTSILTRVLVTKPRNKTPYELLLGRTPSIGFMRPFGCPVTILNTLYPLGKFDRKADEGFLVGYSISSKALRVFNSKVVKEAESAQQYVLLPLWSTSSKDPHNTCADVAFDDKENESEVHVSLSSSDKPTKHAKKAKREVKGKSLVDLSTRVINLSDEFEEFSVNNTNSVTAASALVTAVGPNLTNRTNSFNAVGPSDNTLSPNFEIEVDFSNLETSITVSPIPTIRVHKDHPVTQIIGNLSSAPQTMKPKRVHQELKDPSWIKSMQEELLQFKMQKGHTKEEGIEYEEFFAPVARNEAIQLFLAYASFMGFTVYVEDIIFGSTNKELCKTFKKLMKDKFQMSLMGELTFFLGLQVKKKDNGIFTSQDKYVAKILRKFGLTDGKSASTPIDTEKPLLKDPDGEDVDVHIYRSMIGSLMYLTSSRPDIMFAVYACACFQVTPKASHLHAVKRIFSSKLMLYGLTIDAAHLMLLGHKFWASVSIKKSNDVVKLQALVDKKKCMGAKRTAWNEFSSSMASVVICLTTVINAQVDDLSSHNTKYTSRILTQNVFANMRRIGKGFSGVDTPLFDGMLVQQQVHAVEDATEDEDDDNKVSAKPTPPSPTPATPPPSPTQEHIPSPPQAQTAQPSSPPPQQPSQTADISQSAMTLLNILLETYATLTKQVANLEQDKIAQAIEITKLKQMVKRLEKKRQFKSLGLKRLRKVGIAQSVKSSANTVMDDQEDASKQGGIAELDADEDVTLVDAKEDMNADDDVMKQVKKREKQDNEVMRYQALKRKPLTEAQVRKNMIIYLKNMDGFKMHFFKGMNYNEIRPIFEKHYNLNQAFLERVKEEVTGQKEEGSKRKGDSLNQDIAKKHRINKEEEELKAHLQIIVNDDDDVFTKATPLASKVLVVDYQIHHENNKPYYKIIRVNRTHKLFLSFISLLKNFDREDLEMLWNLVQERFQSSEPKNFSDDFLLNTLKIMFKNPNVEANI
nr:hypothetical protein [Tanacetum cinerariifolium]